MMKPSSGRLPVNSDVKTFDFHSVCLILRDKSMLCVSSTEHLHYY